MMSIQYLEQLPLEMHNEDNVLDARGRKEIAERTSSEVEQANDRLREKEVTIAEQNREARLRQLTIEQDIKEKEATQKREIAEAQSTEEARTRKTQSEQEQIAEEARIAKERRISVAEEERQQEIEAAQIQRARTVSLSEEEKQEEIESAKVRRERVVALAEEEKQQDIEIARINREAKEAEAEKSKLQKLEETALQEADYAKADEQKETVRAVERANRQKEIETIEAEQQAAVDREARQVEADVEAYEIRTVAQANLEGARLDAEAAEEKALAIQKVGLAEAEVRKAELGAENVINQRVIMANALRELVPQLPELVEKMMIPAEKIDSIRILNVNGMDGVPGLKGGSGGDGAASGGSGTGNLAGDLLGTVMNVGILMPVIREVMKGLQGNAETEEFMDTLRNIPGGEAILQSAGVESSDGSGGDSKTGGRGAHSSVPPQPPENS